MKKFKLHPLLKALMLIIITSGSLNAQYQKAQLYVAGTVSSNENMLVTVNGTKTIEGNVVIAELNGKKNEMRTNKNGQAILDFSAIAAGLVTPAVAVLKSFDKDGKLLSTANTTVQPAITQAVTGPVLENLPANLAGNDMVTIKGRNLGADAKLFVGNQSQQVLSASDREMTVFTNSPTGQQPVYVRTAGGSTPTQSRNIYYVDFNLTKNTISPEEIVQANMVYKNIPVGTKLLFTNKSPQTVTMTIPRGQNTANACIYTVSEKNGSLPVNITGITNGNFKIAVDVGFKSQPIQATANPCNGKDDDEKWYCSECDKFWRKHASANGKCPYCGSAEKTSFNSWMCHKCCCIGHDAKTGKDHVCNCPE